MPRRKPTRRSSRLKEEEKEEKGGGSDEEYLQGSNNGEESENEREKKIKATATNDDEMEDEDSFHEEDWELESNEAEEREHARREKRAKKFAALKKKRSAANRKKSGRKRSTDDVFDDSGSENSEGDEYKQPKYAEKPNPDDDDIEVDNRGLVVQDDTDDDDGSYVATKRTRRTRATSKPVLRTAKPPAKKVLPPRKSQIRRRYTQLSFKEANKRAAARVSNASEEVKKKVIEEEEGDDDDSSVKENSAPRKKPPPKKKRVSDSDEEFQVESSEDSVQLQGDLESDDDSIVKEIRGKKNKSNKRATQRRQLSDSESEGGRSESPIGVNIDNEKLGDVEESSDDENRKQLPPIASQNSSDSKLDDIHPKVRLSQIDNNSSDSDESSTKPKAPSRPRLPICFSTEDAVTMAPLPKRHVCYISPDGNSRACFALDTLRKIAKTSNMKKFRKNLGGELQQTFLQPPHFRSEMSDSMLDQIASRFGRDALELDGEYYNRPAEPNLSRGTDDGNREDDDQNQPQPTIATLSTAEEWERIFSKYMDRVMGSQDLYICPLCFLEIHRRIVVQSSGLRTSSRQIGDPSGSDSDDSSLKPNKAAALEEELDEKAFQKFEDYEYDPMSTLADLDDSFDVGATFCFVRASDVKQHFIKDHGLYQRDIRKVQGNDFYMRYRIRAPDGLLQRYLANNYGGNTGNIRRYWNEGHNQSYVYLQSAVQAASLYRKTVLAPETETEEGRNRLDEARIFLDAGKRFFDSFQDRARKMWTRLATPFFKVSQDDIKDFLAKDDEVVDETPHFLMRPNEEEDSDGENSLVERIQRQYADPKPEYDDDDDDDDASDPSAEGDGLASIGPGDEDELSDINGYYSEIEDDDDDDWIKNIRGKKRRSSMARGSKPKAKQPAKSRPSVGKSLKRRKIQRKKDLSDEKSEEPDSPPRPSPVTKRRIVVHDDDDDE